jgi:tellurite resistance protein/uncharacterized protein (DUF697 family)
LAHQIKGRSARGDFMSVNTREAEASLRILACVAMADGKIHDNERTALTVALESLATMEDEMTNPIMTVDQLLATSKPEELPSYIKAVIAPDARELAYNTAFAMANVDGDCDTTEQLVLNQLQTAFNLKPRKIDRLLSILRNMRQSFHRDTPVSPEFDLSKREQAIEHLAMHYATLCAMFWVFPSLDVAIAPDILVITYQCQMIREVAICWQNDGSQVDAYRILSMITGGIAPTGVRDTISNLTKMPPVGASLTGVATTFANTWALTVTVNKYFAKLSTGETIDMQGMKTAFQQSRERGAELYKANKDFVREKMESLKSAV